MCVCCGVGGPVSKKFSAFKMGSNSSNHQPYIDTYTHKMLYMNLMVTTSQKFLIHLQKISRKECKHITTESHQTAREESKKREELQKQL